MFLRLKQKIKELGLSRAEFTAISASLKKRFDFVNGDAHGISFLLDTRFCGEWMDDDTRMRVENFNSKWHSPERDARSWRCTAEARQGRQAESSLVLERFAWVPVPQAVAQVTFASVCSSAASERNSSTHKFLHSVVRNRLRNDKVEKLVHLFFNMKSEVDGELKMIAAFTDALDIGDDSSGEEVEAPSRYADFVRH
jgi:hypothetical protein